MRVCAAAWAAHVSKCYHAGFIDEVTACAAHVSKFAPKDRQLLNLNRISEDKSDLKIT